MALLWIEHFCWKIQVSALFSLIWQHWNGTCSPRKFGMTAAELERLQSKSVEVLELLKANFPEKNGVTIAWKFEKAHSIFCTR